MLQGKAQQAHSESCRAKVEAHLASSAEGRTRLAGAANRIATASERADERSGRAEEMGQQPEIAGPGEETNKRRRTDPHQATSHVPAPPPVVSRVGHLDSVDVVEDYPWRRCRPREPGVDEDVFVGTVRDLSLIHI